MKRPQGKKAEFKKKYGEKLGNIKSLSCEMVNRIHSNSDFLQSEPNWDLQIENLDGTVVCESIRGNLCKECRKSKGAPGASKKFKTPTVKIWIFIRSW